MLSNSSNVSAEQTVTPPPQDDVSGWSEAVIDVNANESEVEHDDPYGYHGAHGYVIQVDLLLDRRIHYVILLTVNAVTKTTEFI